MPGWRKICWNIRKCIYPLITFTCQLKNEFCIIILVTYFSYVYFVAYLLSRLHVYVTRLLSRHKSGIWFVTPVGRSHASGTSCSYLFYADWSRDNQASSSSHRHLWRHFRYSRWLRHIGILVSLLSSMYMTSLPLPMTSVESSPHVLWRHFRWPRRRRHCVSGRPVPEVGGWSRSNSSRRRT